MRKIIDGNAYEMDGDVLMVAAVNVDGSVDENSWSEYEVENSEEIIAQLK